LGSTPGKAPEPDMSKRAAKLDYEEFAGSVMRSALGSSRTVIRRRGAAPEETRARAIASASQCSDDALRMANDTE
jgi:fatty acid/phospholipid biosynthesis enzyme